MLERMLPESEFLNMLQDGLIYTPPPSKIFSKIFFGFLFPGFGAWSFLGGQHVADMHGCRIALSVCFQFPMDLECASP